MGRKLCTVGAGAFAASAFVLSVSMGTAHADDISADPGSPLANPPVEDGVRASGYQERSSTQGQETGSIRAVPGTTGGSPGPGDLSAGLPVCLFYWDNSCG